MSIKIESFTFNPFQENTYLVHDGKQGVIIDPGCQNNIEFEQLQATINSLEIEISAVLLTHSHIDHVLGAYKVLSSYDVDFYAHEKDIETLEAVPTYADVYGFPEYTPPKTPNKLLKGGETLTFGTIKFDVLFTPGHAPGHVVYYNADEKFVINGDVLFAGSFGRVDLPGGDMNILKETIHNIMFKLPEDTTVYCGHGPATTIGKEKSSNYILQF